MASSLWRLPYIGYITVCLLSFLRPSLSATCYKFLSKDVYPHCKQLDQNTVLHWRVIDNTTLELATDADGYLPWLAIGISESGTKGVDYNILIRGSQGLTWNTNDYFTIDGTAPTLDLEQNAVLQTSPAIDRENHTLAIWQRPLDSCDEEDIPVMIGVERTIVWAYSAKVDWDKAKLDFANYSRGILPGVQLYVDSNTSMPAPSSGASTTTFAMPSYPVPPANSTLACVNLALPSDKPYHVIQYAGFKTTSLVHHMMGFVCAAGVMPAMPALGVAYTCPGALPVGCETLNFVWAPGALTFTAPAEAGFAIGAGGAAVLVLQVHYQNPTGVVGQVDSSGFNLTYTSELRNASLGVLTLGNTDLRIPAATDRYTALPNICPASCTGSRVRAPVTFVSNFYLMGRLGVSTMTRHVRNGTAIQPLGRISYWDASRTTFQGSFPGSRALLPNDTLISLCTYNSTNIPRAMTFYGLNAWQELCFNYATFYPVSAMPDLDYCVADTRKNISTCATRTVLAAMAARNATDAMQLANGTKLRVGSLNISFYRSEECQLHDQLDVTPYRKPNTRAAVASIVLVPTVLLLVGYILWSKFAKQEELEALLAQLKAAEQREGVPTLG